MKTNFESDDSREVIYIKDSRLSTTLRIVNTLLLTAILVFVILIYLCICRNNELSSQMNFLNNEVYSMKNDLDSLKKDISLLKKENTNLRMNIDFLKNRVFELANCCDEKSKTVKKLQSKNKEVRQQINNLRKSVGETLIPVDVLISKTVDTTVIDSVISLKHLTIQIIKTSFLKDGSEQKTLLDYSVPVTFSSLSGFAKDSLINNYPYLSENKVNSVFCFKSLLSGNTLSVNMNHNENILFSEEKIFPSGPASLMLMKNPKSMSIDWTSQRFLERTFDPKRFNRGRWECIAGPIIAAAGGFGVGYYATNPSVKVNVYKGDKLIAQDKTYNVPMLVVSGAGVLGGIGLTIKGCLDKKFSWQLTPAEISFKYTLESK